MKYVLFDLDGTLLSMDVSKFIKIYFESLAKKVALNQYDPDLIIKGVIKGIQKMVINDTGNINELAFWQGFEKETGIKRNEVESLFIDFYDNEFDNVKEACQFNSLSKEIITSLKNKGYKLILATNPIFPQIATIKRLNWAGLAKDDFKLITSYENSYYTKPNINYYRHIISSMNIDINDCMMIGNDIEEDLKPCIELGIKTIIIKDCLINKNNKDLSDYELMSLKEFKDYVDKIM